MNDLSMLLPVAIAAPLVAAVILLTGGRSLGGAARGIAVLGFLVPAAVALGLWWKYAPAVPGGYAFLTRADLGLEGWGIRLHLGLNGVSLPLFVMAGVVGLAAGLYAVQSGAERLHQYLLLLLVMQSGLMGVFASIDVFFFYFFHEMALIPTFVMVGIWGGKNRLFAAMKMTIYLTVGAMLSLVGLIALYGQSGAASFDLITLRNAMEAQSLSAIAQKYTFGLLLFGFGILVSLWPFHTWAPLGYGEAPSSAAMLHAGVLKKFGLYGLVQIALPLLPQGVTAPLTISTAWIPDLFLPSAWENGIVTSFAGLLAVLALGNVVVIGLITLTQRDVKQMIGYSSVMHMGYCFLGIATATVLGAGAAVLLMVAHGFTIALLFMLATSLHHRTKTFDMLEMGGLVRKAPVLAAFFVTAMLASIGVPGPGLANFWGEFTVFVAVWQWKSWLLFPVAFGVIISAVYGLRAVGRIFFGPPTARFAATLEAPVEDMRWNERVPALILLVALVGLGAWPKSISDAVNASLKANYPAVSGVADSGPPSPGPAVVTIEPEAHVVQSQ